MVDKTVHARERARLCSKQKRGMCHSSRNDCPLFVSISAPATVTYRSDLNAPISVFNLFTAPACFGPDSPQPHGSAVATFNRAAERLFRLLGNHDRNGMRVDGDVS